MPLLGSKQWQNVLLVGDRQSLPGVWNTPRAPTLLASKQWHAYQGPLSLSSELLELRAEVYVQDLMEVVGKLRQDQLETDQAIRLRNTQVRNDEMLARFRQEIEGARRESKKVAAALPEMTEAQSRQQWAKVQYEEILARKVHEDETGKAAAQGRLELTLRVAERTKSLRKMRGEEAAEGRRQIHVEQRRAETELKTKESALRMLRLNLRK